MYKLIKRDLIDSFSSLWNFKENSESVEISTPIVMPNMDFVTVFLTKQNDEYIVSDDGWISKGEYNSELKITEEPYKRILEHFEIYYATKCKSFDGELYFYKATNDKNMVSSLVYDLSFFIRDVIGAADLINIIGYPVKCS